MSEAIKAMRNGKKCAHRIKKICTQKQKNDTPLETVLSKEEIETLKNEGLADK